MVRFQRVTERKIASEGLSDFGDKIIRSFHPIGGFFVRGKVLISKQKKKSSIYVCY